MLLCYVMLCFFFAIFTLHKFDMDSLFAIHYDGRWSHVHTKLIDIERNVTIVRDLI